MGTNRKLKGIADLYDIEDARHRKQSPAVEPPPEQATELPALAPPANALTTGAPEYRSTEVPELLPELNPIESVSPHEVSTAVPQYRSTAVPQSPIPKERFYKKANEYADQVERTMLPAESKVFEQLLRLSVGFNREICRVRISVLCERTGYTSDKTVRTALRGLEIKGLIEKMESRNSPLGDTYRILAYSGNTAVPQYRSTAAENTPVLESKITGQLKTDLNRRNFDDDAFGPLLAAAQEITGKGVSAAQWREVADVLTTELKIAAGRTTTVSNVPAFFAEHLRRRLFKKDKAQLASETSLPPVTHHSSPKVDAKQCPDCFSTGMFYPNGFENGVARCPHDKLKEQGSGE